MKAVEQTVLFDDTVRNNIAYGRSDLSLDSVRRAAEAAYADLGDANARYGLALIANRRGDVTGAVALLVSTADARHLWLATTLLEREARWSEAVEVYLEIAAGGVNLEVPSTWRVEAITAAAERLLLRLVDELLQSSEKGRELSGRRATSPRRGARPGRRAEGAVPASVLGRFRGPRRRA